MIVLGARVEEDNEPFNVIMPVEVLDELIVIADVVDVVLTSVKNIAPGAETNIPGTIFKDDVVLIDSVFVPDTNEDESVAVNLLTAPTFDQSAYV